MLDPRNDLLPPPSSPTNSSISSSDLDTESTGSFFHDRSTTLGTLMGVSFPAITFRAPSQQRRDPQANSNNNNNNNMASTSGSGSRKTKKPKKKNAAASSAVGVVAERRRRWWRLCRDDCTKPASLGEFLEVERRFGDNAFYNTAAELEGVMVGQPRNGRLLFADGRVLPPSNVDDRIATSSTAGVLSRFPVSITAICSGGVA
ncbi:unnamed protein product [Prunus armeniaca]|uniref:Uncharacterized protein n=1 Tax=Prunus armeniaca TaxID=36596 RepID=A0A6J5XDP1_PRUAR|nr:hypothetical protein GBA52_017951 [Prunus armeniaca]CAB4281408.1 unnamed protein product [Prunus armeniaca]CAB4311819.1 unnamed protein product [Prunus armeniaca]